MKVPIRRTILFINLLLCQAFLNGESSFFLESKLTAMEYAAAPEFFNDNIILTYQLKRNAHFVGARFEHEDYKKLHVYSKNQYGVFFLVLPVPAECDLLKYRIVVDGLWMVDPLNPNVTENGIPDVEYSLLPIARQPVRITINPEKMADGSYRFSFMGSPGQEVSIIGDFNNWDPFRHRLEESVTQPGSYTITLNFSKGKHFYNFFVDGIRIPDSSNSNKIYGRNSEAMSFFIADNAGQ